MYSISRKNADEVPSSSRRPRTESPALDSPHTGPLRLADLLTGYTEPNHPDVAIIPVHRLASGKTLRFQKTWFTTYTWLHFHPGFSGVICYHCAVAYSSRVISGKELSFISDGFSNWKRALDRFESHALSKDHTAAMNYSVAKNQPGVVTQLSTSLQKDQEKARMNLINLYRAVAYILRQGLASRGHTEQEGNLNQLLRLIGTINPEMHQYLLRSVNFTSHDCIDEMGRDLSFTIIRNIIAIVNASGGKFSIVADGTLDVTQTEQLCICIRYVDENLVVHEDFIGLYALGSTEGKCIKDAILDAICAVGLDASNLRGQTYDGASNMTGEYNGCQALIQNKYPLALHFKCAAHCTNLIMQAVCEAEAIVSDSLQALHELGKLHKNSGKFHRIFDAHALDSENPSNASIRPLCPTRWLCRRSAISALIQSYDTALHALFDMGQEAASAQTTIKARGLYEKFTNTVTLLGLKIALKVTEPLEDIIRVAQARRLTISGVGQAIKDGNDALTQMRTEAAFDGVLASVKKLAADLELEPPKVPRHRQPPKRYRGNTASHQHNSPEEHFRQMYYNVVDTAQLQLKERFDTKMSTGVEKYLQMENILLTGTVDEKGSQLLSSYPELKPARLSVQLPMFVQQYQPKSLHAAKDCMSKFSPELRELFREVETLMRILLLCPVSSCEAERSFSALRRLKTWLRNSIAQKRLNFSAVCHVHKFLLDQIQIETLAKEFAGRNEKRRQIFGHFP